MGDFGQTALKKKRESEVYGRLVEILSLKKTTPN